MVVQQLDDRHSSIAYSGIWEHGGVSPEFDSTTTWTNLTGSTATVVFFGTSISVWGTIPFSGLGVTPLSSYSIDQGPISTFTGTRISTTQYNQRFFQSDQLTPTSHTLNITTVENGGYFYIDYLLVVTPDSTTSSTSTSSTSTTIPTTASPTTTELSSSKKELPVGAIIGGVVGAVALFALSIICILVIKRKLNQRHDRQNQKPEVTLSLWSKYPSTKTGALTPFITQPYRPLPSHNYGAEHQADYSSFIQSPPLHDPFDTFRSQSSTQTSRSAAREHPSPDIPLAVRDRIPTSKAAALLESRGPDPFATSRSTFSTQTSRAASREHPSPDIPLGVRDRIPTSKAAALLESRGPSSASASSRPRDRYDGPPPNYNE